MKGRVKKLLLCLSMVFCGAVLTTQMTAPPVIVYADTDDSNTAVQTQEEKKKKKKEHEQTTEVSVTVKDPRDSFFGDIIENFMSVKVNIGNKEFDMNKLESSFKNFVDIDSIKTWSIGDITIYSIFKTAVYEPISAIGVSLAVLFCIVSLIKEGLAFDRMDWRRILVQVIKTVIVVYFIENAWDMLEAIGSISTDITNNILQKVSIETGKTLTLGEIMRNVIIFVRNYKDTNGILQVVYELVTFMGMLLVGVQYYKTIFGVALKLFERVFKLFFALAISPIPIATTLSDSNTSTQGLVKYCIWVFGIYFEGMVIMVGVKLFLALWSGLLSCITTGSLGVIIAVLLVGVMLINGLFSTIIDAGEKVIEQFSR